jgi:hypothetical protein
MERNKKALYQVFVKPGDRVRCIKSFFGEPQEGEFYTVQRITSRTIISLNEIPHSFFYMDYFELVDDLDPIVERGGIYYGTAHGVRVYLGKDKSEVLKIWSPDARQGPQGARGPDAQTPAATWTCTGTGTSPTRTAKCMKRRTDCWYNNLIVTPDCLKRLEPLVEWSDKADETEAEMETEMPRMPEGGVAAVEVVAGKGIIYPKHIVAIRTVKSLGLLRAEERFDDGHICGFDLDFGEENILRGSIYWYKSMDYYKGYIVNAATGISNFAKECSDVVELAKMMKESMLKEKRSLDFIMKRER